ncbi:hypothetical protein F511_05511 [Dorcoceras hygrometricum]|uniref:Uncharacterized protein n=1 Tax=Dorcoceras hygrometricum TaxID=472368 RepID=A0A2Z7BBL3_9LAMI|nr:hypothetical protein F511_05511 [Dorcoceras hygrometricum]
MAASAQFRPQNRNLGMVMREVDEDLAIFLGMRNVEQERGEHLLKDSDELEDSTVRKSDDAVLESNGIVLEIVQSAADENYLNLEIDENDYDWLYAQPDSTLHPSVELEVKDSESSLTEITNDGCIAQKSEACIECEWSAHGSTDSVASANKKPLSSGDRRKAPRAATPTRGESTLPAKSKSSHASKPTLLSSKPTCDISRSSTPVRATPRASTPVGRQSIPVSSKPASRSTTPTCKPATTLTTSGVSGSVRKTGFTTTKNLGSRMSSPSEILSSSHDASDNLKVLMPKRTVSASRGRPNGHTTNSSRDEKRRQKSCSPAKVRASIISTAHKYGSMVQSRSRGHSNGEDDVNPVLIGSKMVERVVNMRKLAPPKQDEHSTHNTSKKSSHVNSGFGRSLSKKSLDMAIRHMEIRRTIPDDLRTIATRVLSSVSSKYASSGNTESPLTSSSDSSKSSINNKTRFLDGTETEDSVSVDSKHSTASSQ